MTLYEEEIDLRPYMLALIRHWKRVAILGVLFGAAAVGFSLLQTRTYTASATILVTRSRAVLALAEDFPTISENVDTRARTDALLTIAQSDVLARETYSALEPGIEEHFPELRSFRENVSISAQGDSLMVSATAPDPGLAAAIANEWSDEAILMINQAYSGNQPLEDIQEKAASAREEYNLAQAELEQFLSSTDLVALNQTYNEATALLDAIGKERTNLASFYSGRSQQMEILRLQAESLKRQLESGSQSDAGVSGDALALLLARAGALGPQSLNNIQLSFTFDNLGAAGDTPAGTQADFTADVETIIALAESERQIADQQLAELAGTIVSESRGDIDREAINQLLTVNAALENAQATERELTSRRDLAWSTYQTLTEKQTEIQNAGLANNAVSLASRAVAPLRGDPRGTLTRGVIAGIVGVVIGFSWIIGEIVWVNLTREGEE